MSQAKSASVMDSRILIPAVGAAFKKLNPRALARNPVMFVVATVSVLTTVLFLRDLVAGNGNLGFSFQINLWLWFTVLFANFAEAVAEGRGKAQAESLRKARTETQAKLLTANNGSGYRMVPGTSLKVGDLVLVEAGDIIPSDGEVIEGVASVNEAAITGESAPVIRESGGDRSAVTGGTQVLSDWIRVRITAAAGSTFIDRMIALVEGAERQKTPNEIALNILLAGMTLIFVLATATIPSFAIYAGGSIPIIVLVALFVTLIPTTIGALLSAIGIAGMDRLVRFNVLAMSGRAVEAAGDVDTLLLDKTGTITLGNRQATTFRPVRGVSEQDLADAAQLASLADETPEGRSIVVLAKEKYAIRGRDMASLKATFVPFTAQTRMSGVDLEGASIRKGAVDAVLTYVNGDASSKNGSEVVRETAVDRRRSRQIGRHAAGGRPRRQAARRHPAEGHRQGRHPRALHRTSPHGHPHRDDNRRQPADGSGHRRRGRRRRLPRPSNAGDEAGADARGTVEGQARRHVRRRHQRCAGARPGRCRRRHEHRHGRCPRGRQHGRSRSATRQSSSRSSRSASSC